MINITLPNDMTQKFTKGVSGLDIAEALGKKAVVIEVDGNLQDLYIPIYQDATVRIITSDTPEGLEGGVIRHDVSHILAQAVKELYPETQVTIEPTIENGFYYDFARPTIINDKITREVWERDYAIDSFQKRGEYYKVEIIKSISEERHITLYRQGDFIDLCRGPHSISTGYNDKYFKLIKVSGAYWRGDSTRPMLRRIYGTAWAKKSDLEAYLHMLEEAKKRDHRKLGQELQLFHFQEEAPGIVLWHDRGWTLFRIIQDYMRKKIYKDGYIEVNTPILVDKKLWEGSGHWDKFRDDTFTVNSDEEAALKPMNCPRHTQIFNQTIKSYRDLPFGMAEFGCCHRYEASGALYGLMRARSFVQDDAHIFCIEEQITEETIKFCKLLKNMYSNFGFTEIKIKFSDRPMNRAGSDEIWDSSGNSINECDKSFERRV